MDDTGTHLGADTQVSIRHKLGLFMRVCLHLHVGIRDADADTR